MTREQLFKAMVGIDEKQLEHSERAEKKLFVWISKIKVRERNSAKRARKKSAVWIRWGAAACIGLLGAIKIAANQVSILFLQDEAQDLKSLVTGISENWKLEDDKTAESEVEGMENQFESDSSLSNLEAFSTESAELLENSEGLGSLGSLENTKILKISKIGKGSFEINGVWYTPIDDKEYQNYGLVSKSEEELLEREAVQEDLSEPPSRDSSSASKNFAGEIDWITEEDLGEKIGIIEESDDAVLVGCTVYQYASYPKEEICIVQIGEFYQFYTQDIFYMEEKFKEK